MILEVTLGVALKGASADQINDSQARALDEGYTLEPYEGHFRYRYVMGVRPARQEDSMIRAQETVDLQPRCSRRQAIAPVVEVFGLSHAILVGTRTDAPVFRARIAGMWAAFQNGDSRAQIARRYNRDWSTVYNATRRCEEMQERDMGYRRACERLLEAS